MDEQTKNIVRDAIMRIINATASELSIERLLEVHEGKVHFVPTQYCVLGGILQSLNIKFGNFIEKLLELVVENDPNVVRMPDSGMKVPLLMTAQTDALIDLYITNRQLLSSPDQCDDEFNALLTQIFQNERQSTTLKQTIRKDIDALFKNSDGQVIYLEIKYNDDHDTGKFVDINRKFLKTYAGLLNRLAIDDPQTLKPILYYFNPQKRWGPIYVPTSNIFRGPQLFEAYFSIKFDDINQYLKTLGTDPEVIGIFDNLYKNIRAKNYSGLAGGNEV